MQKVARTLDAKYLKLFCLLVITVFLCGLLLWKLFLGYYYIFPVTYGKFNYPFITTEFQGNTSRLGVSIGCRFPLFLRQKILEGIDKQLLGTEISQDLEGGQREVPSYLIPELKIGNLLLKNAIAYQSDDKDYDTLGKFLGGEFNLLLDFPHDRIIACDSLSRLRSKKIIGVDWVQVPFEMHRAGIVFHADTDFGPRKLILNTGCTMNFLNLSSISFDSALPFVSSSLSLGGCSFGNVTFDTIALPEDLAEIDGFIGMDFLKEHALYLDYTHKVAYIAPSQRYFERIPITFTERSDPVIDVLLEHEVYPMKLDLGNFFSFSLGREILTKISKTKYGTSRWHDFRGKQYESPIYTIPEIRIGNLTFFNVFINQDSEEFHANTTLIGAPLQLPGVIGLSILRKYNLLLDFPHSAIYACKDLSSLQDIRLFSHHLLAIPFTAHPDGIIFSVETDTGTHRLMLDTGATTLAIRAPHPSSTKKFSIMGHDFGAHFVMPIDLNTQFDFDGLLGMDFLHKYSIFIDYFNKIVFIDLQNGSIQN